ncbi:MAG: DUF1887 family protein [Verrucomicrobiales bacterium]|nr:DUF1887 family protein [Verrucomicrobiales bacterium]
MILLSLASRQIWPQVLSVAHLKPDQLFLLHSDDISESAGPARRLERLFEASGLVPTGHTQLERVPHDDFAAIERRFDELIAAHQLNLAKCVVNFTGGNKLMATAVFRCAARRGLQAFYLERGNVVTWFEPRDGDLHTRSESLPAKLTNPLDPAALLACQFGDEVVRFPGERLTLNEKGARVLPQDLAAKLQGETRLDRGAFDFRKWLAIEGPSPCPPREGDNLEYATACALLLAGVPAVRRSVELATLPGSPNAEGELDLVFNWNGRLWVVDCKDRVGAEAKVDMLRTALLRGGALDRHAEALLSSVADDLKDRDLRLLREDLLQIAEVGGLLGCALAVRSARPPQQALEFAASRHPKVEVLLKSELIKRLPAILAGRRPR